MRITRFTKRTLSALIIMLLVGCTFAFADDGASPFIGTWWSILPPIIAIALALITKEVYLSLFVGIAVGSLLIANFNPVGMMLNIFSPEIGMISRLADSWNVGILLFTIMLGIVGAMCYKAGGSVAYGNWAKEKIKTRKGAQLATFGLGVLIFVDDYFNCLTVGSVMRNVTDSHKISRSKLSYLVDSTAAPVVIIAPISSWAAAVAGSLESTGGYNNFELFVNSIPYNFYALLTLTFILCLVIMDFDFGLMRKHEQNAMNGDLFSSNSAVYADAEDLPYNENGKVADLLVPIIVLILSCIIGLLYTGGWKVFGGDLGFQEAFANCDASLGLVYGAFLDFVFMFIWFLTRKVMTMKEYAECLVQGFKDMVPPVLILAFAWTLSSITLTLGLREVVRVFVENQASSLAKFLPVIVCLIAMGLSFSTGTSWGTFGMLLPIVISVFPFGAGNDSLAFVGIAACLSGAVFGDHISPISDTTIMSSAGARCDHINHVSTQAPYAFVSISVSLVFFLIAGFFPVWYIITPISIATMIAVSFFLKKKFGSVSDEHEAKINTAE